MVPARVTIREVRAPGDPALADAHRLLRRIFPRSEMLPRRDWIEVMRERQARVWTDLRWHLLVAEVNHKVVGAATGSYLGNVNVGIVGYVAVARAARSRGIGPRLRRRLLTRFERDAQLIARKPLTAILGEVRKDNPWLSTLIRREDVLALDFPYYQPSLEARRAPVPLVLYYQSLGGAPRRWLSSRELTRLLYTMWRRTYRIANPLQRPAFQKMLKNLAGRRLVGERPLPGPRRRAAGGAGHPPSAGRHHKASRTLAPSEP